MDDFSLCFSEKENVSRMYGFLSDDGKYIRCKRLYICGGYMVECWYGQVKMFVDKVELVLRVVEGIDCVDHFLFDKETNLQLFELCDVDKGKIFGYNE